MQAGPYDRTVPAASASRRASDAPSEDAPERLDNPESRFELLHALGRGSYGCVYKARVVETGEIVAVKVIPLAEQDEMESIQKEIGMLRDCSHHNVVKYFGSWRAPDALWIAMEYCAGGSVSDIMAACDAPLEETVISYVAGETLAGLAYLHALGRVHRDIKCGNILLTDGGEVKLADFGVAAQLTSTLSKRNTFIGTPHWMAPEVITASQYDGKVDVWALGISAVEMAERYPPRWRVNPNRVIFMVVRDPPPRLADKERWSLAFQDFVAQCLNKDARSRPTARYLQQHRFIAADRAAGIRALMPAIHRARAQYAAAAEPLPAAPTASDDGFFSWRQQAGGTVQALDRFNSAAYSTVVQHGPGGGRGAGAEASGTVVTRGLTEGSHGAEVPPSGAALGREPSAAASAQAEASVDYLAAVHAVGSASAEVDLHPPRPPSAGAWSPAAEAGGGGPGPPPRGLRSEAQRLLERLYALHSSGEVVPLPYLQATDVAPLALVGAEGGGPLQAAPDWRAALADVLAEATASGPGPAGAAGGEAASARELPPALARRVQGSPVLLNLATALARHRQALEEQRRDGVPPRAQDALRGKAEALSDTVRTILCL